MYKSHYVIPIFKNVHSLPSHSKLKPNSLKVLYVLKELLSSSWCSPLSPLFLFSDAAILAFLLLFLKDTWPSTPLNLAFAVSSVPEIFYSISQSTPVFPKYQYLSSEASSSTLIIMWPIAPNTPFPSSYLWFPSPVLFFS